MQQRTIPIFPKIQARSVAGTFARWRWAMVWLTQLVFYGTPWLLLHGRQAVLFDFVSGRFFLFGAVLYPQDLVYLSGLLVISALLLFFVSAMAGRLWCGFACPQTVYTELFQWLELRTEGDRQRRLRLDRSAWTADKVLRRGSKHLLWALLSLWTGLTFVGYFTPVRDLFLTLPLATGSWEAFWILFYAAATYFNAGYLRESVCQHMCPYGRFQGSLMDSDTLYVAYDHQRPVGRCVDCTVCVQVCPVGIDIRQGLQAACISCGLCIDACNQVMDKLNAPRGLIRLASEAELSGLRPRALTLWAHLRRRRVRIYGGLLLLAVVVVASAFAQRSTLRVNAMRDRGVMARTVEGGAVENVYRLQVMNAQDRYRDLQVEVRGQDGLYLLNPVPLRMLPAQAQMVTLTVRLSAQQVQRSAGQVLPIQFAVSEGAGDAAGASGGRSRAVTASTFIVD